MRQDSLKLEKKWVTQNPWFCLAMTLIWITVTDAFLIPESSQDFSSPTLTSSFAITSGKNVIRSGMDANGLLHYLVKYEVTKDPSGQKRTKMRKCKLCIEGGKRRNFGQCCITCGESYSLCNKCDARDCFDEHIKKIKRITRQSKKNGSLP